MTVRYGWPATRPPAGLRPLPPAGSSLLQDALASRGETTLASPPLVCVLPSHVCANPHVHPPCWSCLFGFPYLFNTEFSSNNMDVDTARKIAKLKNQWITGNWKVKAKSWCAKFKQEHSIIGFTSHWAELNSSISSFLWLWRLLNIIIMINYPLVTLHTDKHSNFHNGPVKEILYQQIFLFYLIKDASGNPLVFQLHTWLISLRCILHFNINLWDT